MTSMHAIKDAKILENSSRTERQRIITAYKDLFSTNCYADIEKEFAMGMTIWKAFMKTKGNM